MLLFVCVIVLEGEIRLSEELRDIGDVKNELRTKTHKANELEARLTSAVIFFWNISLFHVNNSLFI